MKVENNNTWVMLANGSECKIFSIRLNRLKLLKGFYCPDAHSHSVDLGVDRPGRVNESNNITRHTIEPKITPQRKAKVNFSHLIADYLNESVVTEKLQHLILLASSEFLGILRKFLSKQAISIITKEINKDLVDAKEEEILKHIYAAHT